MHYDVLVIGAGAAGLVAAADAASRGRRTLLLENNKRPGIKILMSGGTRCNLTHATDKWGIVKAYGGQGNFLHSALAALSPAELVRLLLVVCVLLIAAVAYLIGVVGNRAVHVADMIRAKRAAEASSAPSRSVTEVIRAI